jgi:hypothetical protein
MVIIRVASVSIRGQYLISPLNFKVYLPRMSTDQTRMGPLAHGEATSRVVGAAFEVHNILGYGFLTL